MNLNRIERIWVLNALLFVVIFFIVSYSNRFAEDDFVFSDAVIQNGIWNATLGNYYSWNTRWISIAWLNTWYKLIANGVPIFVFNWMSLLFMCVSVYRVIINFLGDKSIFKNILLSIIFCSCLFFATFNIPDTWFWINSTTMYLWNIGFLCLAVCVVTKQSQLTWLDFLMVIMCGLYIGASSEPLVITLLLIIPVLGIIKRFLQIKISIPVITYFWVSILLAFAIAFYGTGHSERSNALPQTTLLNAAGKNFYFTLKILMWHFPAHLIPLFLMSVPWLYIGYINKSETNKSNALTPLYLKGILLLFVLTYINTLPVVYLMGDYGPSRAWMPVSFYITSTVAFLFYKTGCQLKVRFTSAIRFFEVTALLAFGLLVSTGIYQIKTAKEYAKMYDLKIPFDQLPESGWLHSAKAGSTSPH